MPKIDWKTGVYLWRNLVNGKVYVGGAYRSLEGRQRDYLFRLPTNRCHNRHLQAAWNLYGMESFEFSVIERCHKDRVEERENFWIKELQATDPDKGYNICLLAGSRLGVPHSDEARQKMSQAKKGKPGLRTGAVLSEETKKRIGDGNRGKTASEETKTKMSATRRGRKMSEAHREAYIAGHWSKGPNAEAIAEKIRQARTGTTRSEETRAKISEVKRRRNAERREMTVSE